jgi:hypothetical protein
MKHIIELRPKEEVMAVIRRHWFILAVQLFFVLFLFISAIILAFVLSSFSIIISPAGQSVLLTFIIGLCSLFAWGGFFAVFTNYYLDAWIITTERIIDIEQITFFVRDVSEFRLDRVQDLTIRVRGLIPTLLDFGNIEVVTAGEKSIFTMKTIPHPVQIQKIISEEMNKAVARHGTPLQP